MVVVLVAVVVIVAGFIVVVFSTWLGLKSQSTKYLCAVISSDSV